MADSSLLGRLLCRGLIVAQRLSHRLHLTSLDLRLLFTTVVAKHPDTFQHSGMLIKNLYSSYVSARFAGPQVDLTLSSAEFMGHVHGDFVLV
jgi:hypothetical protein